ncbi:MAG: hypothetical protein HY738_04150 [Bacteroidia bacterium]|nr:hypothetical protein [Bacteroidia bacterium]
MILNKIFFCIFYGFVWTITLLPLKVLYVFSDIIFVILYYIISYRKDIIQNNLKNSFPQKTIQEINLIHKLYIRHLSDIIIETLKIIHLSENKTLNIVRYKNCDLFDNLYKNNKNRDLIHNLYNNNKSIILVMGHYGNWELLIGFPLLIKYICIAIYKPLKNIYFDSFINCLRGKFGTKMAAMNQILKTILEYQQKKFLP